jgi:hypothetical protein
MSIGKLLVSLQSRDMQQLLGKLCKIFVLRYKYSIWEPPCYAPRVNVISISVKTVFSMSLFVVVTAAVRTVSVLEDHLAVVVRRRHRWHTPNERIRTMWSLAPWEAKCGRWGQWWQHLHFRGVAGFHAGIVNLSMKMRQKAIMLINVAVRVFI